MSGASRSAGSAPAALLFDMDGVLIDTSGSYRRVIVEVVRVIGADRGRTLTPTLDWVSELKRGSGFNNDWDASLALARGALELGDFHPRAFSDALVARGGGLAALESLLGPSHPALAERVRAVFQRLYLGDERYAATEPGALPELRGALDPGPYLDREAPLVDTAALRLLAGRYPLAIATGRPEAEAHYALARAGWAALFPAVVSHDDCVRVGKPGKPDPWPLLEAHRRLGAGPGICWYIGDTPDDMRAAVAAGMVGVGVSLQASHHAALSAAGAHWVVPTTADAIAKAP